MPNIVLIQNEYLDLSAMYRVITSATKSGIIGGYALDPNHAFLQMKMVKECFHKTDGVLLHHFLITFSTRETFRITVDDMLDIGFQIGKMFRDFQLVYGVHFDTDHLHLHLVMNTVSFVDGHKYAQGLTGFWDMKQMLQKRFPKSDIGIYRSFPNSLCNQYSYSNDDIVLKVN